MKKHFAEFYDAISDRAEAKERAKKVLICINKNHPNARSILELGIGDGDVLSSFPKKCKLYGLDIVKEYVELARKKIPHSKLLVSSMHNFETSARFDAIFLIFDPINFLRDFEQWEQTFNTVHRNLNEKGLFIFDMYTLEVLERSRNAEATFWEVTFGFASDKAIVESSVLTWDFKL